MIKTKRVNAIEVGSCNACNRAKLYKDGLVYPYVTVTELCIGTDSYAHAFRLCDKCLSELRDVINGEELDK